MDLNTLVYLSVLLKLCHALNLTPEDYKKNAKICKEQARVPYFDEVLVVGKPWRVYYTWNVEMEDKCLDLIVKNATDVVVNRIWHDMHKLLETQPDWKSASLYTALGPAKHELLLFPEINAPGNFLGVPNIAREDNLGPARTKLPLFKFFLKLLHNGKYLLMIDCKLGVASMLSRERPPYRAEVASVAASLVLGEGTHACLTDKRKGELVTLQ